MYLLFLSYVKKIWILLTGYGQILKNYLISGFHRALLQSITFIYLIIFSPGATTPIAGCILQPSSGL